MLPLSFGFSQADDRQREKRQDRIGQTSHHEVVTDNNRSTESVTDWPGRASRQSLSFFTLLPTNTNSADFFQLLSQPEEFEN